MTSSDPHQEVSSPTDVLQVRAAAAAAALCVRGNMAPPPLLPICCLYTAAVTVALLQEPSLASFTPTYNSYKC